MKYFLSRSKRNGGISLRPRIESLSTIVWQGSIRAPEVQHSPKRIGQPVKLGQRVVKLGGDAEQALRRPGPGDHGNFNAMLRSQSVLQRIRVKRRGGPSGFESIRQRD